MSNTAFRAHLAAYFAPGYVGWADDIYMQTCECVM